MKKLNVFFAILLFSVFFAIDAKAQEATNYFVGKWDVNVEVPGGAKKMLMLIESKDGKLTGGILDAATKEMKAPFTKVEQTDENTTVYFMMSAHNVYMVMEKKDDNNFTASMLDMFECQGVRVVENK
jgi:hypothetical protein